MVTKTSKRKEDHTSEQEIIKVVRVKSRGRKRYYLLFGKSRAIIIGKVSCLHLSSNEQ